MKELSVKPEYIRFRDFPVKCEARIYNLCWRYLSHDVITSSLFKIYFWEFTHYALSKIFEIENVIHGNKPCKIKTSSYRSIPV